MGESRFLVAVSTLTACFLTSTYPALAQTPQPYPGEKLPFRPETFFLGRTEGTGTVKVIFRRHLLVHVHGRGRIDNKGILTLDQDIEQSEKPLKHRQWKMQSLGRGRYAATLSDAIGPVAVIVQDNTLRLSFSTKGGLRIRQTLIVSDDGRRAINRLSIKKMGVVVAVFHETIVKVD